MSGKLVSDGWCVTKVVCLPKLCVFERCRVAKMMCDRLFMWQKCERWRETEMVCDRVVGEKFCVANLCVNDGVCGKVGHDNVHVTKVCVKEGVCDKDMTEVAVRRSGESCV